MRHGRVMITAASSGHGKTVVTMGLIGALKKRALPVLSCKCGPDYIDPMFHERVLGVPCRNLDTYLMGEDEVLQELAEAQSKEELVVVEGAMGFFDGLGMTSEHSAAYIAALSHTPVIAVLDAGRDASVPLTTDIRKDSATAGSNKNAPNLSAEETKKKTLRAVSPDAEPEASCSSILEQLKILKSRDEKGLIAGVIINRCGEDLYPRVKELIGEQFPGTECLGYLPGIEEAYFPSRHLGLVTAAEAGNFTSRSELLSSVIETCCLVDRIIRLAARAGNIPVNAQTTKAQSAGDFLCRIAVARDEAFCFTYRRALENLERAGARLCYFSPLRDRSLPEDIHGLYLPGGYPELYGGMLEENGSMRLQVLQAVSSSLPTVAECGGFLYLQKSLCDETGKAYSMTGFFRGHAKKQRKLVRFGYLELKQEERESLLFEKGETIRAHEFHYWDCTENGDDLEALKKSKDLRWRCGFTGEELYAAFPHIYLNRKRAERFVRAALRYKRAHNR